MRDKMVIDLGQIMDEIFEATKGFGDAFKEGMQHGGNEYVDYYPNYSYPPVNIYVTQEKSLIFEFALAGFNEKDLNVEFKGDYLVFSAKSPSSDYGSDLKFFKRRLKFKDVPEQKFFVPEGKFDQKKVKAVFKNGILKIVIPAREIIETKEGIKVEIVKEDD
ncbi:MAG: Hsp20/alpha crystallin family protein [Spirochaetes bacterium]|nr:MAG: Hsp20/alpha crystallin family protein [Spirochaetota bacterium]